VRTPFWLSLRHPLPPTRLGVIAYPSLGGPSRLTLRCLPASLLVLLQGAAAAAAVKGAALRLGIMTELYTVWPSAMAPDEHRH
jgi:hypothetical protein